MTFQKAVDVKLSTVKWQFALVYLDEIAEFSRTPAKHIDHVRLVHSLFHDARATLMLRRASSLLIQSTTGGHFIKRRRLKIAFHSTDAVHGIQSPTSLTKFRSFLGLCNVFYLFVPIFAPLAVPLNKRLQKVEPATFELLNDGEKAALDALKNALVSPSILALPSSTGHIALDTDAFAMQAGCVQKRKRTDDIV